MEREFEQRKQDEFVETEETREPEFEESCSPEQEQAEAAWYRKQALAELGINGQSRANPVMEDDICHSPIAAVQGQEATDESGSSREQIVIHNDNLAMLHLMDDLRQRCEALDIGAKIKPPMQEDWRDVETSVRVGLKQANGTPKGDGGSVIQKRIAACAAHYAALLEFTHQNAAQIEACRGDYGSRDVEMLRRGARKTQLANMANLQQKILRKELPVTGYEPGSISLHVPDVKLGTRGDGLEPSTTWSRVPDVRFGEAE